MSLRQDRSSQADLNLQLRSINDDNHIHVIRQDEDKQVKTGILWFTCVAILFTPSAVWSSDPFIVVVETASETESRVVNDALAAFECGDQLHTMQRHSLESADYYKINNPVNFVNRTGLVYSFDKRGSLRSTRFWVVAGPEVFDEFITNLSETRGASASAEGTPFKVKLSAGPQESKVTSGKGTVKVTRQLADLFICYQQGVIFLGDSPHVFDFEDCLTLKTALSRSVGKDWYLWIDPTAVSKDLRLNILKTVEQHAGFALQQHDGEKQSDFTNRRAVADVYFQAIRALFLDTTEITSWLSYPTEGQPFQFRFDLKTAQSTTTSRLLHEMGNASTLTCADDESPLTSCRFCLRIPEELKPVFSALASRIPSEYAFVQPMLKAQISERQFDLMTILGTDEGEQPVIQCLSKSGSCAQIMGQIREHVSEPEGDSIRVTLPQELSLIPMSEPQSLWLSNLGESLAASINSSSRAPTIMIEQLAQPVTGRSPILEFSFDPAGLDDFTNKESLFQMLGALEKAYHFHSALDRLPRQLESRYRKRIEKDYQPFSTKLTNGGDWSCRLTATTDSSGITVSATAGLDAFQFLIARKYMAEAASLNAAHPMRP